MAMKRKPVLGKGLKALIPKAIPTESFFGRDSSRLEEGGRGAEPGKIPEIEIEKILPNPYQPRQDFDQQTLDELKQSIVQRGLVQPITVRRGPDGTYQLISGERRVRAARGAGLVRIPAYVIQVESDGEMLELALIENLQREHLNPIEVAISYQRLMSECQFTQEQIAQKIGKDRTTVTNLLRLLKLPPELQQSLRQGEVSMGHARALINLPDEKMQIRVCRRIVRHGLSVREVEEIVRRIGTGDSNLAQVSKPVSRDNELALESIATRIRYTLGTKVKIHPKENGRGEILIEYYSDEDLERILDLISIIEKQA